MKKMLFLIIVVIVSLNGYAQDELGTKTKAFPPVNKEKKAKKVILPSKKPMPIETPNPFDQKTKPLNDFKIPKNDFILPGEVVYRSNQNLGEFKTSSHTANVKYRDAAFVDGDKVRVYLNDKVVKYQVDLDGNFQGFQIILVKGVNKIDFEALNEGTASPNTAEFKIFDEKGLVVSSNQWNLGTGFKATIVLIKE